MYTRYYDNYEERARKNTVESEMAETQQTEVSPDNEIQSGDEIAVAGSPFGILSGIKTDDIILIGLLILVLSDGCDDYLLPIILGFLLINNR